MFWVALQAERFHVSHSKLTCGCLATFCSRLMRILGTWNKPSNDRVKERGTLPRCKTAFSMRSCQWLTHSVGKLGKGRSKVTCVLAQPNIINSWKGTKRSSFFPRQVTMTRLSGIDKYRAQDYKMPIEGNSPTS